METALYWIAGITTGLFVIRLVLMVIGLDGSGAADAADALHGADAMDVLDSGDPTDVLQDRKSVVWERVFRTV